MDLYCKCKSPVMIIFSQCNKCQREIDPEIIKLWQSNAPQLPSKGGTSLRENMDQEIATMIPDSEEIINFSHCSIRGSKAKDVNFVGTVVVTDKNVYLVKRKFKVFGKPEPLTKESMALNQITGIDQTFEKYLTIKSFHIRITRANNEDILYGLTEASASQIMKSINDQMHKSSSSNSSVTVNPIDPVEQLTKLAALLEKGLLTDEEFQKKKRELLGL